MEYRERVGRERIAARAGDGEAVVYERRQLVPGQGKQVVARGHALCELSELQRLQHRQQLRLTEQDHLQQLALVGLEIGEKADLLKDVE